jgi:hypothetical protein
MCMLSVPHIVSLTHFLTYITIQILKSIKTNHGNLQRDVVTKHKRYNVLHCAGVRLIHKHGVLYT